MTPFFLFLKIVFKYFDVLSIWHFFNFLIFFLIKMDPTYGLKMQEELALFEFFKRSFVSWGKFFNLRNEPEAIFVWRNIYFYFFVIFLRMGVSIRISKIIAVPWIKIRRFRRSQIATFIRGLILCWIATGIGNLLKNVS